ncbi:hypothetical protein KKP97_05240 [Methanothermococcus sp. SCGC AD-155-C09]|nr:hypothetical protein [Methanothermococcus sp. SCGC AD-155-C09]
MATITEIGTNSAYLEYTSSDGFVGVMDILEIYLTNASKGYVFMDSLSDDNNYVFKNVDDAGRPYCIKFRFDTSNNNRIYTELYEYDETNNQLINKTYRSNERVAQPIDLNAGGYFYIFAHPKWFVWYGSSPARQGDWNWGSWTGVFVRERAVGEDATNINYNYPAVAFTSGGHLRGSDGNYRFWGCPRLYYSAAVKTGENASKWSYWSNGLKLVNRNNNNFFDGDPDWFTGQYYAADIIVGYNYQKFGRLYGLKEINSNLGNLMDIVKLKVDANYFLDDTATTETDFFIIPGGSPLRFAIPK